MAKLGNKIAVPAARSRIDTLKLRRRIILAALLVAAAAGLFATYAWMSAPKKPPVAANSSASPSVALATQVALDYLSGRPTSVPVAKGVPNDFGMAIGKPGLAGSVRPPVLASVTRTSLPGTNQITIDLVKFYIIVDQDQPSTDGTPAKKAAFYYQLSVPMNTNPDYPTPVLAAIPTIMPLITANPDNGAADMSGVEGKQDPSAVSPQLKNRLATWATTFTKAGLDSPELKALTGDTDPTHQYSGLGGWTTTGTPEILSVVPAPADADGNPGQGNIFRVALVMTPPGVNGGAIRSEYDVWVTTTGSNDDVAPIVAWAPAGSYSLMYPYMNARTTS